MKKTQKNDGKRIRDRIQSPHAEAIINIFKKRFNKNRTNISIETIRDLAYSFVEHAIENTQIYYSDNFRASFPYTVMRSADLAKVVCSHYKTLPKTQARTVNGQQPSPLRKKSIEFVFGSFLNPGNGGQFTFFEEALHQFIKRLPRAIEMMEQGLEPENDEVYIVGSPTNVLGRVSQRFADSIKGGHTFERFGALYAEFVEAMLPKGKDERGNVHVYLYGISMGGSFATQTAEHLISANVITQSREISASEHIPFAQVRADTLPGMSTSRFKKWQIPIGFIADGPFTFLTNRYTFVAVTKEGQSTKAINGELAKRGINPDMSSEQTRLKNEVIKGKGIISGRDGVINDLRKGIPVDPNLKLTEVRAIYDPVQYSSFFRRVAQGHRKRCPEGLGRNLVWFSGNHRRSAISQAHTLVFFRENELRRMEKAAAALEWLNSGS
jgi:hypothetical protein